MSTGPLSLDPAGAGGGAPAPEKVDLYERWRKIYPRWVDGPFQTGRRITLVVLVLVYFAGPWLRWNGEPGFRFDLASRRFTVFWATFVPDELVLLAWLLLIAALVLFTVTVAFGRVFCGWACPQTVWSLVYFTIERFVEGDRSARMRLDRGRWNRRRVTRKAIKYTLWAAVAFSISITFLGYFQPIEALLPRIARFELSGWEQFFLIAPAAASFFMSGVLREQVCFHMCPYARFQSVMLDRDSLVISYDAERGEPRGKRRRDADLDSIPEGACIDCYKCVTVCPTGIDIRDGLQYECIGCAACVDACDEVMQTMGYGPSLVRYSSENRDADQPCRLLRPRLLGYAGLIAVLLAAFAWVVTHRLPLDLDVLRDRNRLVRTYWDGGVENVYTLRVANRSSTARQFEIDFASELPLALIGDRRVRIEAGRTRSVPVSLALAGADAATLSQDGATAQPVRFSVRPVEQQDLEVSESSLFHLPAPDPEAEPERSEREGEGETR